METVGVAARESRGNWFGIAFDGDALVATAVGSTSDSALASVLRCIPAGARSEVILQPPPFVEATAEMLGRLESGDEGGKRVPLSSRHLSVRLRHVLCAAAAIPIGYVSSYGNIAKLAGSEPRAIGRTMATNPLYPIVPCHRVVGADFSLVGYGGRQDVDALTAKLARLRAEAQGFTEEREIEVAANAFNIGRLAVYPVEWAIAAGQAGIPDSSQLSLFE